jgi:phosphoglycolate phosphatase
MRDLVKASALVFDFDGTLAPNLDLPDMRRQVITLTEANAVPIEIYKDLYIVEVIDAAAEWLQRQDTANAETYYEEAHRLITDIELSAAASTDPFPGVRQLALNLRQAGRKTAVVTRNCNEAVRSVFPDVGDYFDTVLTRDDVRYLKPDTRHITQALDELSVTPGMAAMIGDGGIDMHTGKSLDMICVGVLTGSGDADTLINAGADLVIDHVERLMGLDWI